VKASIVIGAATGELVGETPTSLVFANGTCACATGELVEGAGALAAPADALVEGGLRVEVRDRTALRRHPDGWVEPLFDVPDDAQVAFTDQHLVVFHDNTLQLAAATGPVAYHRLPAWIADGGAVRVAVAPSARAIVFVSPRRVCWLAWDQIATLYGARSGVSMTAVLPGTLGDAVMVVVEGAAKGDYAKRTIVIEDRTGKRFSAKTFACRPVVAGERLTLHDVESAFPVLRRSGDWIRVEQLTALSDAPAAPLFPAFSSSGGQRITPAAKARALVGANARGRIVALRDLGIVAIDDAALDVAITHAFGGDNMTAKRDAITAGTILWAHATLAPSDQFLVGEAAQLAGAGWWIIETWRERPLAARFDERTRAVIEAENLLVLVPPSPQDPLPTTCAEAVAELSRRIGAPVEWRGTADAGHMILSIRAAALLYRRLH
jgi:hypothetical protein